MHCRPRLICTTFLLLVTATLADDALPTGEQIMDQYVQALGGAEAFAKLNNRTITGTMEFVGMNMQGAVTIYGARPNKRRFIFDSPQLGKIEEGCDGVVAWESSMMTGPRVKAGEELAVALRDARFDGTVHWRDIYKDVRCTGTEQIEDQRCYKVEVDPKAGKPEVHYFNVDTSLLVKVATQFETPMGLIPFEFYSSDYKKVDGVLISHRLKQVAAGQEIVITSEKVTHNSDIPEDQFALPEPVRALIDKASTPAPTTQPAGQG